MTFILGIGDRHLDNIMVRFCEDSFSFLIFVYVHAPTALLYIQITRSGQMFHIDFGFIFGQDPKPFPPPFRFTRSMADAMGGEDSPDYARFKSYCCQVKPLYLFHEFFVLSSHPTGI